MDKFKKASDLVTWFAVAATALVSTVATLAGIPAAKARVLITDCKKIPADAAGNQPQCHHGAGFYPKLPSGDGKHKAVHEFHLHDNVMNIVFFCTERVTAIKGDHLTGGVVGALAQTPRDGLVTAICPSGNAWQGPSISDSQIQRTQGIKPRPPAGYDVIEHSPSEPQGFLEPKAYFGKKLKAARVQVSFAANFG